MEAKHTATPYRAVSREELEINGERVIEASNGDTIALVSFDEDAEFIVRACNSHDDLVKALKDVREYFVFVDDDGEVRVSEEISGDVFDAVCAALAKAGAA